MPSFRFSSVSESRLAARRFKKALVDGESVAPTGTPSSVSRSTVKRGCRSVSLAAASISTADIWGPQGHGYSPPKLYSAMGSESPEEETVCKSSS